METKSMNEHKYMFGLALELKLKKMSDKPVTMTSTGERTGSDTGGRC